MEFVADILLIAGAFGAGTYCIVLARRLNRFNDLEKGVGGAIAVLSAQVDDMTKTLDAARKSTGASATSLNELTGRAEGVAQRLELLVASMHDLPEPVTEATPEGPADEAPAEVEVESAEQPDAGTEPGPHEDEAGEQATFKSSRTAGEDG